jgi:hypothetical protein
MLDDAGALGAAVGAVPGNCGTVVVLLPHPLATASVPKNAANPA